MKKFKFASLAILGINMALLLSSFSSDPNTLTPEMRYFYDQLSPTVKKQFLELDPDHRKAAMSMANQGCNSPHGCGVTKDESVRTEYQNQMEGK